jgi:hypothetical protein
MFSGCTAGGWVRRHAAGFTQAPAVSVAAPPSAAPLAREGY